ncbi:MAG TPA: FecR domain-containing protein [Polyangiaceae bacterium]
MIDEAGEARRLLAVLRERPHSIDPARTEAQRARAIPRLESHVERVAARRANRSSRRWILAFAAAAAVLVGVGVGVGVGHWQHPVLASAPGAAIRAVEGHLVHRVSGATYTVSAGDRLMLPVEGELETDPASRATLETMQGLELHVEGGSRLTLSGMSVSGPERSVELQDGQIGCSVPKLPKGEHFSVVTPNARVVVHGTRFTVRVESVEVGVTRTCVRVQEGVVSVHDRAGVATLLVGDEWGCGAVAARGTEARSAPPFQRRPLHPSLRADTARTRPERTGTLAEETALLQTGLAAERRGQRGPAAAAFTRLLSRFPDSPLAPEARGALDRVSHPPASSGSLVGSP